MSEYRERLAACLWQELAVVYPDLAGRETDPEKRKLQAERDEVDLFGPMEKKEAELCPSRE